MGIVNLEKNAKYNFKTYSKIPSTDTLQSLTFDISDLPNYKTLTVDNIAIKQCQFWGTARSSGNLVISSYDSGTGIVTVAIQNSSALFINNNCYILVGRDNYGKVYSKFG